MSNQDYISRTPAKKKKNTKSQKNSKQEAQAISAKTKLIAVIALLLVTAFAYGLWALKNAPETTPPSVETPVVKEKKAKVLPKPPKEKWTYVKDLQNKEVEVGEYKVTQGGPYKLQCGSFKTSKRAEVLKANIAFAGLEANVRQTNGKNGTWYKVVLGPYSKKRQAEKDKNKLKKNSINTCQILPWK